MLKVRLQRVGRRNDPSFRVVVTDSTRGPKSGKYIEMLGSYNPRQKSVVLNGDRIKYWMSVGAKPSDTMHNMLIAEGVIKGKKIPKHKKSKKKELIEPEGSSEPERPEAAPVAAAPATETPQETPIEKPAKTEESAPEEPKKEG